MKSVSCNGAEIPKLGLGTFELRGDAGYRLFSAALEIGYRHFDTAQRYENEAEIGAALAASGLARSEFFVTTKIWPVHFRRETFRRRVEESCRRLGVVPDLLLLHFPPDDPASLPAVVEMLAAAVDEGHTRHIGVSNFSIPLVKEAIRLSPRRLTTNQVEYNPFLDQAAALRMCRANGMSITAYSPLAQGRVMHAQPLTRIGRLHGKNAGQVALRWLVQQDGVVAIPRSASAARARSNFEIFDFALTTAEMGEISGLAERSTSADDPAMRAPEWPEAP
jgi:diketogulonate reductase-like aldo/keto reductase